MIARRRVKFFIIFVLALVIMLLPAAAYSERDSDDDLSPQVINGRKYKIGYIESDEFVNYPPSFYYILKGLEDIRWLKGIDGVPYEEGQLDTKTMWDYLSTNDVSDYLEFVPDFHYSLAYIDDEQKEQLVSRLSSNEVDLVIVLGTDAGNMIADTAHSVNSMIFSVTDAVLAGISETYEYSNKENIWAHTDPARFERQLRVFYDIFNFKKLGIVMEDSDIARAFTPVNNINDLSEEYGFETVIKYVDMPKDSSDIDRYKEELARAYDEISDEIDAFYITVAEINAEWLKELLEPFYEKRVPVFSQLGGQEVAKGALMSINVTSFEEIGQFGAVRIAQVLKGEKPGNLVQEFVSTPRIDINLGVADRINYPVSFDLLLVADKIYLEIE
ncbi:MAG: ABC transporter substrate-binding protein [Acetivibrionales bacterium]|jgi:ABC-type uncharacterized transport system substrate-binding protein